MNEIEIKINELINLIDDQEEVKRYKLIEEELNQNEFVKNKIEEFKKLQKKMAIYESHQNIIPDNINEKYTKLYNELFEIPIYSEYIFLQQEINDILQQITQIIEYELNEN